MNAISQLHPADEAEQEKAECRTRHRYVCQELIDLGMKLARRAAQRALDEDDDAQAAQNQAAHNTRPPNTAPTPSARDPNLAFTRLSCSVRLAVTLEARIVNNFFARAPATRAPASSANAGPADAQARSQNLANLQAAADHGILSSALGGMMANRDDRWQLQETFDDIIEDTLSAFPDDSLPAHFARACRALDIEPDLAALPPDLAEFLAPPQRPAPGSPKGQADQAANHTPPSHQPAETTPHSTQPPNPPDRAEPATAIQAPKPANATQANQTWPLPTAPNPGRPNHAPPIPAPPDRWPRAC